MKGKQGAVGAILVVFGAIALVILAGIGAMVYQQQSAVGEQADKGVEGETGLTESISFCANNPDIDWEVRARDLLTATASYRSGQVYLVNDGGNVIIEKDITGTTSTRSDLTDALKCGHDYEVYPKVTQDGNYSAWAEPMIISSSKTVEDPVIQDIEVKRSTGAVKIRCYDNLLSAWMYQNDTESTTATDYVVVNDTGDVNFTSTTGVGTNMALGNSEDFDVTCQIKTDSTDYQAGLNAWLGLDYSDSTDTGDWVADDFIIEWKGANVPSSLPSANDVIAMTGNELFYKLDGGIRENYDELHIRARTDDSETIDRDLVFRLCFTGTYLSDEDDTKLLQDVCFRDDGSSRTEITTATARGFRFMID